MTPEKELRKRTRIYDTIVAAGPQGISGVALKRTLPYTTGTLQAQCGALLAEGRITLQGKHFVATALPAQSAPTTVLAHNQGTRRPLNEQERTQRMNEFAAKQRARTQTTQLRDVAQTPKQAKQWVIAVMREGSRFPLGNDSALFENLRYLGLVTPDNSEPELTRYFYIYAPRDVGKAEMEGWARRGAERMQSFGFNAVAVALNR
jgi:hypothetical protein